MKNWLRIELSQARIQPPMRTRLMLILLSQSHQINIPRQEKALNLSNQRINNHKTRIQILVKKSMKMKAIPVRYFINWVRVLIIDFLSISIDSSCLMSIIDSIHYTSLEMFVFIPLTL